MKRFKILTSAVSVLLCLSVSFCPLASASVEADLKVKYSNEFAVGGANTIGWENFAVEISDGGIFTDINGDTVSFGGYSPDKAADIIYFSFKSVKKDRMYPVLETHFYSEGVYCTLVQFVDKVSVDGTDVFAVYSSLTAEASSFGAAAFPKTDGLLIPLGDIPGTIEARGTAGLCYVTPVFCEGVLPDSQKLAAVGSFDERYAHMTAFWNEYTGLHQCFSEGYLSKECRAAVIDNAVNGTVFAAAVYDGHADKIKEDMPPFAVWLMHRCYGLPDGYSEGFDLAAKLDAICADIKKFDCGYADGIYLYVTGDGAPTPESCFSALSELAAGIELLPVFGINDTKYSDSYEKLLYGTETVFMHTVGETDGAWELCRLTESDDLILPLDPQTTSAALCSWYIKNSAMGRFDDSGRLRYVAREAFRFTSLKELPDIADAALATVQPSADGGVCIGRGVTAEDVINKISVTAPDTVGGRIEVNIQSSGNNVIINVDNENSVPFTVAIPFFKNNIESSACAFDADSGVLTPSAGTKTISVTLKRSASELAEEYAARTALETALFEAYGKNTEGCTNISKREFEAAKDIALAARNAGIPAAQMTEAAENLSRCSSNLSKIISGYTYTTGSETVGKIFREAEQKFSLPKSGTVTEINISGVFGEGTVAEVYDYGETLDTHVESVGEAQAEKTADGMRFKFNFEAEPGRNYYLVFHPADGAAADVIRSKSDNMAPLSEFARYSNAALKMEISVVQADRTDLDAFYETCQTSDVSRYTRESVKNLQTAMHAAADLLRTPDAEVHECEEALADLKQAFSALTTYASDMKVTATSPVLYVLIGVTIVLLTGSLAAASGAGRKKKKEDE